MALSKDQKLNFISLFQQKADGAISNLSDIEDIIGYGLANGLLEPDAITPEDLEGTAHEGMDITAFLIAIGSVGSVILHVQKEGVFSDVAPILPSVPI